jgi:putative ABC transport system substrate-binding protein
MEKVLAAHGVKAQRVGVHSDADIPTAVAHSCRTADVIIVPTDTTVASAIKTVGASALKAKKPLIVCDNELVCPGVLMAAGSVDYFKCGIQTAKIALDILVNKQKPEELSVINTKCGDPIIHAATAKELGIVIPENFGHQAI